MIHVHGASNAACSKKGPAYSMLLNSAPSKPIPHILCDMAWPSPSLLPSTWPTANLEDSSTIVHFSAMLPRGHLTAAAKVLTPALLRTIHRC